MWQPSFVLVRVEGMLWSVIGAAAFAAGICGIRRWISSKWGRCAPDPSGKSLFGKVAVITGASSGLGRAAAEHLASRGATVVLACRDINAARRALRQIQSDHPAADLVVMHLDLESFDSIRVFAKQLAVAFSQIHILINNAGVALPKFTYDITKEGHEMHFGVNHLGHFLLTNLILDLLKNGAPSRIVIVSSMLHQNGKIDFDDINLRHAYDLVAKGDKAFIKKMGRHHPGYCNSKLMNVYFGRSLTKLTKDSNVDVFTLCPGFTYTNLFRYALKWYHYVFMAPVLFFFMRSVDQGVQTIVHCAADPSLTGKSGGFYRDCKLYTSKIKFDDQVEQKLWDLSQELIEKVPVQL